MKFLYGISLKKSVALYLNKIEYFSHTYRIDLCHADLKLAGWLWGRNRKCDPSTDRRTDVQTFRKNYVLSSTQVRVKKQQFGNGKPLYLSWNLEPEQGFTYR